MGKASRRKKERKKEGAELALESAWQYTEKVVQRLEQCIAPDATVQRDQELPSLIAEGVVRQCDVTILWNAGPRQILTIVEVQKRGRKVELKDFIDWREKRDEVGAHCLICVSEQGFPASVIAHAKLQGNRVRLLTLSELEGEHWPLKIVGKEMRLIEVGSELIGLQPIEAGSIIRPPRTMEIDKLAPIFQCGTSPKLLSAVELSRQAASLRPEFQHLPPGIHPRVVSVTPPPGTPFKLVHPTKTISLKAVSFQLRIHIKRHRIPMSCSGYVQYDHKGKFGNVLAYALTAEGPISDRPVRSSLIFIAEATGLLRLADYEIDGLPSDSVRLAFFTEDPWK
jgi:hypothetical protein